MKHPGKLKVFHPYASPTDNSKQVCSFNKNKCYEWLFTKAKDKKRNDDFWHFKVKLISIGGVFLPF